MKYFIYSFTLQIMMHHYQKQGISHLSTLPWEMSCKSMLPKILVSTYFFMTAFCVKLYHQGKIRHFKIIFSFQSGSYQANPHNPGVTLLEQAFFICCTDSINCPDLDRGHLFRAGHWLNFCHFHEVVSLFCNKKINKNKSQRCTKPKFKRDNAVTVQALRKIPAFS